MSVCKVLADSFKNFTYRIIVNGSPWVNSFARPLTLFCRVIYRIFARHLQNLNRAGTIPGVRFAIAGNIKYNREKLTVADNDSLRKWEVEYEYDAGTG